MTKHRPLHQILGISEEREREIAREVVTTFTQAGEVDAGIEKLMETYSAESMMAGMRLLQAINLNNTIHFRQTITNKHNAAMN